MTSKAAKKWEGLESVRDEISMQNQRRCDREILIER